MGAGFLVPCNHVEYLHVRAPEKALSIQDEIARNDKAGALGG